ncbi:hypothetical protein HDV00_003795 [Rhizophlyctis rosea]|nr:hypothetical protein HDV00_003795 [Rhizophlyctis rosea]
MQQTDNADDPPPDATTTSATPVATSSGEQLSTNSSDSPVEEPELTGKAQKDENEQQVGSKTEEGSPKAAIGVEGNELKHAPEGSAVPLVDPSQDEKASGSDDQMSGLKDGSQEARGTGKKGVKGSKKAARVGRQSKAQQKGEPHPEAERPEVEQVELEQEAELDPADAKALAAAKSYEKDMAVLDDLPEPGDGGWLTGPLRHDRYPYRHFHGTGYPVASRLLEWKWQAGNEEKNKEKLKQVTSTVNSSPPRKYRHLRNNLKGKQLREGTLMSYYSLPHPNVTIVRFANEERQMQIERDNKKLHRKMCLIEQHQAEVPVLPQVHTLNETKRKQQLENINRENLALLKRIEGKGAFYDHKKYFQDRRTQLVYLQSMAEFPLRFELLLKKYERASPQPASSTAVADRNAATPTANGRQHSASRPTKPIQKESPLPSITRTSKTPPREASAIESYNKNHNKKQLPDNHDGKLDMTEKPDAITNGGQAEDQANPTTTLVMTDPVA